MPPHALCREGDPDPVLKKGPPSPVTLTTEKRQGNKCANPLTCDGPPATVHLSET